MSNAKHQYDAPRMEYLLGCESPMSPHCPHEVRGIDESHLGPHTCFRCCRCGKYQCLIYTEEPTPGHGVFNPTTYFKFSHAASGWEKRY